MSKAKSTSPEETPEVVSIADDVILDYLTNKEVKDTPKERVRQRITRALFLEYGLSVEDMEPDYPIPVELGGKVRRRTVEIAIFQHGQPHELQHLSRVVVCRPEPKNGKRGVTKLRDHEQAKNDLEDLKAFMTAVPSCRYGLWTDGLDFFFLQKEITRFEVIFEPRADWPLADETQGSYTAASDARLRRADPEMLRIAFPCRNGIAGDPSHQPPAATACQHHFPLQSNPGLQAGVHDDDGRELGFR